MVPGLINYKYKHFFTEYKILTIQGIVALNARWFLRKTRHFSSLLTNFVASTISKESPIISSPHTSCENWLRFYDNHLYRKSLFFKAPIPFLNCNVEEFLAPVSFLTIKSYKTNVKGALLRTQNEGISLNLQNYNVQLYNISGLIKPCITRRDANYLAE